MRKLLLLIAAIAPGPLKLAIYRRVFGWHIGKNVRIGLSYIDGQHVSIGNDVYIGHFNSFRQLRSLTLRNNAVVRNLNKVDSYGGDSQFAAQFVMENDSSLMSRHTIDSSNIVEIGEHAVVGGCGTTMWTHSLQPTSDGYEFRPMRIRLGRWVYVGGNTTLVGCDVPVGAMVGAGSVVNKQFPDESVRVLIAGNPAVVRKRYDGVPVPPVSATPETVAGP